MQTIYIIKNDKIYEVTGENKAVKIDIVDGVPKRAKETVEYNPAEDFPYAFFEIRAKYSNLFEVPEEEIEESEPEELKEEIEESEPEELKEEKPNKSKSKSETENED